jgi:hypothetical protein
MKRSFQVHSRSYPNIKHAFFAPALLRSSVPADVLTLCRSSKSLCPACALFGCMSQRSRVSVSDLEGTGGATNFEIATMMEQFGPNIHHLGRFQVVQDGGEGKLEVLSLKGRKFAVAPGPEIAPARRQSVEAIPAGHLLHGTLRVLNVLPAELGGFLVAVGRAPSSKLKIGAGKGQGFGRIALQELSFRLQDSEHRPVATDEGGWSRAFEASDDRWPDGERELVRIHQGWC